MKYIRLSQNQQRSLQRTVALTPGFRAQGTLGTFLDEWLVCEVLAKKLIVFHKGLSDLPFNWSYTQLKAALDAFGYDYDTDKMKPAFHSDRDAKRWSKPARVLRNGYIHTLSPQDRKEIEMRNSDLLELLRYWKSLMVSQHNK